MKIDGKNEGPRQSMSWLHTWVSLLLGWLLYAIFLTGTLSFFQNEITIWMKPELHQSLTNQTQQQQLQTVLNTLQKTAPDAASWSITLPTARQTTTGINVQKEGEQQNQRGGGGRNGGKAYDTATGEEITARETRGGSFLYRFHFELYGMERNTARWIVGIATMFMFVAIISGIITHKKIFKDFFTFRPGKGQRSWLDAHNATAVFALPFHLMITFSGLLLLLFTLMPYGVNQVYEGGRREFLQAQNQNSQPQQGQNAGQAEGRGMQARGEGRSNQNGEERHSEHSEQARSNSAEHRAEGQQHSHDEAGRNQGRERAVSFGSNGKEHSVQNMRSNLHGERERGVASAEGNFDQDNRHESIKPAASVEMADMTKMLTFVQQQWAGNNVISTVRITAPNTEHAQVEIRAVASESLVHANQTPSFKFNAVSGALIAQENAQAKTSIPSAIYNLTTWLHQARGVSLGLRWVLFLSGVLGTLMVATGLVLWVVKRQPEVQKLGYKPWSHRIVEILNVPAVVGLPIACAAYFWANRMIPAQLEGRADLEIKTFFIIWLITLIHSAIRPYRKAWLEQLALSSVLFLLIPILNAVTGGRGLWSSIYHGQWVVATFDLACLLIGALLLYAFYKLKKYPQAPIRTQKIPQKNVPKQPASTAVEEA